MADRLKTAAAHAQQGAAVEKVRKAVEEIIADIEKCGEAAVRELSQRFDGFSPESFRMEQGEIDRIVDSLPERTREDIAFAYHATGESDERPRDYIGVCLALVRWP